jgi:peptide/nickel transport system permease protein
MRRPHLPRFARTPSGGAGLFLLVAVVLLALIGPVVAPHAIDTPIGVPAQGRAGSAPLGTDFLGRDVLSRALHGGVSVVWTASLATVIIYLVGIAVGLAAGYNSHSLIDPLLMRMVDFLLSFPAILLLLLMVTGLGTGIGVAIVGVVLVLFPGVARLVRTSTLEVAGKGYVEAAVARGERPRAVMVREILPNVLTPIMADVGIRFAAVIIFIASLNYLGLGNAPPAADWGVMVSENRSIVTTNIWSVLAPVILLGLLTIGVNLVADSYARTRGRSGAR